MLTKNLASKQFVKVIFFLWKNTPYIKPVSIALKVYPKKKIAELWNKKYPNISEQKPINIPHTGPYIKQITEKNKYPNPIFNAPKPERNGINLQISIIVNKILIVHKSFTFLVKSKEFFQYALWKIDVNISILSSILLIYKPFNKYKKIIYPTIITTLAPAAIPPTIYGLT